MNGRGENSDLEKLTGTTCPTDSALSYDNFGKHFMDTYCISCHASALTARQRRGAPSDHNFDTLAQVHATEPDHIDETTAAGPNNTNTQMPPAGSPTPSEAERRQLAEWVACGLPGTI